jgi:hypothetical protein
MRQGIYCASFDAHKVNIVREKKFGPLYCEWLKTRVNTDEAVTGSKKGFLLFLVLLKGTLFQKIFV